jgi:hypothetical protein
MTIMYVLVIVFVYERSALFVLRILLLKTLSLEGNSNVLKEIIRLWLEFGIQKEQTCGSMTCKQRGEGEERRGLGGRGISGAW